MPEAVQVTKRFRDHRIYKPRKDGSGAASNFELKITDAAYKNINMFWVGAQQDGASEDDENAKFHWKNPEKRVQIKLGLVDLGEILAVLKGYKESVGGAKGIYHQSPKGNSSLSFAFYKPKEGAPMYTVRLASKPNGGSLIEVKHTLTLGEAATLEVLITQAIQIFAGWY